MRDPFTTFTADEHGRLAPGLYHWIAVHDVEEAIELGWVVPEPTDTWFCHHDEKGILCHWPMRSPMKLPRHTVMKHHEVLVLDLPIPPSVNDFERDKNGRPLGNRSPSVKHWIQLADVNVMNQRRMTIKGWYVLTVILSEKQVGKFDISNRIKALEDYLERIDVIENDRYCWKLIAYWGDVEPDWCRVELRPWG